MHPPKNPPDSDKPQHAGAPPAFQWKITRRDWLRVSGFGLAGMLGKATLGTANAGEFSPVKLRFGMVTDCHYSDRAKSGSRHYNESIAKMTECVELMNTQNVDFVVFSGDMIDKGDPDTVENVLANLQAIEATYAGFKGPRYHVLGNHDMDSLSKAQFLGSVERTGIEGDLGHYSFDTKGMHFVVLDACFTSDGTAYDSSNFHWTDANVPQQQLDWLKADLAATSKPVIIFIHQLLDGNGHHDVNNAAEVRKILEGNPRVLGVFQGHQHAGQYNHLGGIHFYTLRGMVEGSGEDNSSYAIVDVHENGDMVVTGYRRAVSREMPVK